MPDPKTPDALKREHAWPRTERLIFRTVENRAKLMAIYDQTLAAWPVPFDASCVNTRYGKTHVIASGVPGSPPLVLAHPAGCVSCVWSSIIAALSQGHRTYALDTIGELGRSRLDDHDRYPKAGRDSDRTTLRHLASAKPCYRSAWWKRACAASAPVRLEVVLSGHTLAAGWHASFSREATL